MKRNNSISRTFPFTKSYSFPRVELRKRFSDIFSSISLKRNNENCTTDPLLPSYTVTEQVKTKKEMIFIPELDQYIEVDIDINRNIIRSRQELLDFTQASSLHNETNHEMNDYYNDYFDNYLLPTFEKRKSIYSIKTIDSICPVKSPKDDDTYSIDSYYLDHNCETDSQKMLNLYSNSIYSQSDCCSICSLSTISSNDSILGKNLLQPLNPKYLRNSI